jgi:diaminopimelate decarboxylase
MSLEIIDFKAPPTETQKPEKVSELAKTLGLGVPEAIGNSMNLINGKYYLGSVDALELALRYGTPLYVYDTAVIARQYHRLTGAFSGVDMKIRYACKALTNPNILRFLRGLGAGLDTVSIGEVQTGLRSGFLPEEIIFTPNSVSIDEIVQAMEMGVMINIDNISILEQFGNRYGGSVAVGIRINPHIFAGAHHQIATGHIDSKFGISIHQMRHVQRVVESTGLRIIGLQMHTGSDILDAEVFVRGAEILFEQTAFFPNLQYIDFGSGFKVSYYQDDTETDVEALGARLSQRFRQFCTAYGRELQLWFEPGKYLVSASGYLLTRVNVVKTTTATVFAGVDTGFNHLIRPMFYDAYHHIENLSNPQGPTRIYTVVGNICETDTFAWDRKLHEVQEGDVLAFHNAGAYCYEMASSYNTRPRPAEVMILDGKDYLIRRRETLDDVLMNVVDVNA